VAGDGSDNDDASPQMLGNSEVQRSPFSDEAAASGKTNASLALANLSSTRSLKMSQSSTQDGRQTRETTPKSNRGFASMDKAKQREIASKGGHAAHAKGTAHEFTPDEARRAGRKGGEVVSRDRQHMAAIGRAGGQRSHRNRLAKKQSEPPKEEATTGETYRADGADQGTGDER
jgi:general stress protein YciG